MRNRDILHYVDTRLDGLRAYHDMQAKGIEAEIDRRVRALQDTATATAEEINHRLEGMNEIRGSLTDVLARAVTRDMYDAGHEALSQRLIALIDANAGRIDRIESTLDRQRGRQAAYAALAAIAGVLVTLFILAAAHISVH